MDTSQGSTRRVSGFKPTGHLQLGNLLAAIRPMVTGQYAVQTLAFIADQHALTVAHDPTALAALTREVAAILLAAGLDPVRSVLFVQSHVPAHTGAHYLLESTATYGEARRMIQFRDRADGQEAVRLSLLTYPVLMAADILLYAGAGHDVEVPVGADQGQHLELVRIVARRFNTRYGETFALPRGLQPGSGARIMDLSDPRRKMEKTNPVTAGVVYVLDPPDVVRRKITRAVTDADNTVAYDAAARPGVSNLLDILGCVRGCPATELAREYSTYARLKADVADAVIAVLEPLQRDFAGIHADPAELDRVLAAGGEQAARLAGPTLAAARQRIGLLPGHVGEL